MSSKPLEAWVPITELPTLVERKSKQTALNDRPEPMSLPINDLSYVLQSTKEYIHRNLEPNFQYGVAVLVLLGRQSGQ